MGLISDVLSKVKNPTEKLGDLFAQKAEDALTGALSDAFAKIGLGAKSRKGLLGNLASAAAASLLSDIFGKSKNRNSSIIGADGEGDALNEEGTVETADDATGLGTTAAAGKGEGDLMFPADLGDYRLQIAIKEYVRPNATTRATMPVKKSVYLPLPRTMEDRHEVDYEHGVKTGLAGIVADRLSGNMPNNYTTGNVIGEAAAYGLKTFTKSFGSEIFGIATQFAGATTNPNLATFFNGPSLRKHRFDWLLAPENEEESETIRSIITTLKKAALPNFTGDKSTVVLQYPNIVHIKLLPWADGEDGNRETAKNMAKDKNMYAYKHAMIESISVNYSPDSPVFIETKGTQGAAPAFMTLSMNIIEIDYFLAEDFGDVSELRAVKADASAVLSDAFDAAFNVGNQDAEQQGLPQVNEDGTVQDVNEGVENVEYENPDGTYNITTADSAPVKVASGVATPFTGNFNITVNEKQYTGDAAEIKESLEKDGYNVEFGYITQSGGGFGPSTTQQTVKVISPGEEGGFLGEVAEFKQTNNPSNVVYGYRASEDSAWQTISKESFDRVREKTTEEIDSLTEGRSKGKTTQITNDTVEYNVVGNNQGQLVPAEPEQG